MEGKGFTSGGQRRNTWKTERPDPVRNFERWKKKHEQIRARAKQTRAKVKKPAWVVEQEDIRRLVTRYEHIDTKEVLRFSDFPISRRTLLGLQGAQYRQPTEIQKQTIGFALRGKDVLGAAKTGSGKTLAFLIPVLECLYRHQWTSVAGLGALIISPTRELAYQTFEVLRKVGKKHEFSAGLVIGGKDIRTESESISQTNIVICTPGRMLQHMDQTAVFQANDLLMLVLDEADRILDMGFADTLNAIVENLPKTRQTLLFSATQTKSVKDLARLSLKDPEYVWVHEQARFSTPASLEQNYVVCELHQKVNMLYSFIRTHLFKKVIVFFACCKEVQYLFRVFCRLRPGTSILALHGKQHQMKRVEVYNMFLRKQSAVLFATDIAARGLDFPAVHWVLQVDCPEDADTYIHRVGRTARYKEGGEALLLLLPSEEDAMVAQLQDKKVPINKIKVNPDKMQSIQQKLEAYLAEETDQKERAQRCFASYLRSVYLMKNKDVFDVFKLNIEDYALSLGLAVAPRVRFLHRAQTQRAEKEEKQSDDEEELRKFKAQLGGSRPQEDSQSSDDDDDGDDDEDDDDDDDDDSDKDEDLSFTAVLGADDKDEDDLRDLDLLTVKRKDVFNLDQDQEEEEEEEEEEEAARVSKKILEKGSKFKVAKKLIRRNFVVNTKVTFNPEGQAVQLWPPAQQAVTDAGPDEEDEVSGINLEKAKERLRLEDQEFDKQEYTRRVKAKHRERRLKAKAARREASNRTPRTASNEEDEDEVQAYLASHSEDEFDPSTLPDPDRPHHSDQEEEEEEEESAKRQHSRDEEEKLPSAKRKKKQQEEEKQKEEKLPSGKKKMKQQEKQEEEKHAALDTGLSLAEDEELVLHLLGGRR